LLVPVQYSIINKAAEGNKASDPASMSTAVLKPERYTVIFIFNVIETLPNSAKKKKKLSGRTVNVHPFLFSKAALVFVIIFFTSLSYLQYTLSGSQAM
jgi:hypothetical protein